MSICFFSINHYYAENQGLKRTENKRSVQFKFTKKLNFRSFQSSFGKSELSSVQSSPKKELLNWTELFRSVRPIHCFFETCAWIKCTYYVAFWTEFAHLHSAGRLSFLYPEVGCSIWQQQGIKKYKRVLAYFCSLRDLPTYLVKTILSVKMHSKRDDCYLPL